ncbi:MAG: alpha/beta hydrolase [Pseudomonadota bacterium]
MPRRAIVLVPGFGRREQTEARSNLVEGIIAQAEGFTISQTNANAATNSRFATLDVLDDHSPFNTQIDVIEAYWGDLIPDWSNESNLRRFKRGTSLVIYWALGGLWGARKKPRFPPRTMLAIVIAAIFLVLWYLSVFAVVVTALAAGEIQMPGQLEQLFAIFGGGAGDGTATDAADGSETGPWQAVLSQVASFPVIVLLLGLAGAGGLEKISNVASYTKAYLLDEPTDNGIVGVRAKARQRVVDALREVFAQDNPAYDEVYVVCHSLGGAIAVDALAQFGAGREKVTLFTWGTAMGVLALQSDWVEDEIDTLITHTPSIAGWIDVVFRQDYMASVVPISPEVAAGQHPGKPVVIAPKLPYGSSWNIDRVHEGYYVDQQAVKMLVKDRAQLP